MNGDMIGRVIKGRYKLIDERGRGNFATVYIARDLNDNRIFAIKIMHLESALDVDEDELLARFQREAHIMLNLSDPHIVRIFEYGSDNNSIPYIVMDYIDGQHLKYYMIQEGPFDAARALYYTHQIVEGLDTAFKAGVVHRDIKPQNILINSKDVVKIADFGLARSLGTESITQTHVSMGTPYYMSPEQAESGREAKTYSDLYSVAVVLFEMLAGRPPFTGEHATDIIIKHLNEKVPSICRLRPDLPAEMDLFMQKALAKLPKDRYATPQEFIVALEQLQERVQSLQPLEDGRSGGPPRGAVPPDPGRVVVPPPKEARLVVISNGHTIPLKNEIMVVGRQDPTLGIYPEINLADKTVGRRHAYLRHQKGTYTVEDLNALNKTRLNGVILTPHQECTLKDGDILRFGSVEVRFEMR